MCLCLNGEYLYLSKGGFSISAGSLLHLAHMQSLFPTRQSDVITSWTSFLVVSVYLMKNAYYVSMQHPREGNGSLKKVFKQRKRDRGEILFSHHFHNIAFLKHALLSSSWTHHTHTHTYLIHLDTKIENRYY